MKLVKRIPIILSLITIVFIGIKYTLYKPTTFNSIIASKIYKTPANTYFIDDNFYKCVIDSYNDENNKEVAYTYNLSDEELKKITTLECKKYGIRDTTGIEKLTSLLELNISYNSLSKIDLSNNTELTYLKVDNNSLTELDISKNIELIELSAYSNQLIKLDVSKNINLTSLDVWVNNLTKLDVSNNEKLEYLDVEDNNLTNLDISKNIKLMDLYVDYNNLTELNISKNTNLEYLYVCSNNLSELDVSKNTKLIDLEVENNNLTELDISKNINLKYLYVSSNQLTSIDVSKNTNLETLIGEDNKLTELDVSKNINLKYLDVGSNNLSELDLSNNKLIRSIYIDGININKIKFYNDFDTSKINSIIKNNNELLILEYLNLGNNKIINPIEDYIYYFNDHICIKESTTISNFINNLRLTNLTAKIFDGDTEKTEGNIAYGNILKIYDKDNNLIDEVRITIFNNLGGFKSEQLYQCVIDTYNKNNNTELSYTYNISDDELQTITSLMCSKLNITDATGIENLTSLQELNVSDNYLSELDVSKNTNLKSLHVYSNKLTELDISNNTELTHLNVYNNRLTELDLSQNTKLIALSVGENNLTELDVSKNTNLEYLIASSNRLSELDLSKNTNLKYLDVDHNNLTELDISKNTNLETLIGEDNKLTELDVSKNINLKYLNVSFNNLTELDLSKNTNLKYLYVYSNRLSELDLSKNINLEYLDVDHNNLTELDVSKNTNLEYLNTSSNRLTELDVSKNTNLKYLYVYSNQFTELDLSNNIALSALRIDENTYSEILYVYKGETINAGNNVKIPSHLNWNKPTWITKDENIATIDENGIVTGVTSGTINIVGTSDEYTTTSTVNVVEITSDKYDIYNEAGKIYIGSENKINNIKSNITPSHENITIDINDNKLQVKYNDDVLKEFEFLTIDFGELPSSKDYVSVTETITYEEFTSNITSSTGITYKIYNGSELVTSGNIEKGMEIKVYYNDEEIDTISIIDEYLIIDESINVNENNKYFSNIKLNTPVNDILNKIDTTGKIVIKNKNNVEIKNQELIGTGSIVSIELTKETHKYSIIIHGDIDGDGQVKLPDIMKIANYVYKDKNSLNGVYKEAADYDENGKYDIQDIMKSAKKAYGGQ